MVIWLAVMAPMSADQPSLAREDDDPVGDGLVENGGERIKVRLPGILSRRVAWAASKKRREDSAVKCDAVSSSSWRAREPGSSLAASAWSQAT
jgi:hypothetical protein